ncbi:Uncharacterised protein [Mycobacterium tuberculosis]|uniref:Uncharacterized protein n=1 Tax=Mycobacterium tuberculosis TaxID=1773 RepID=A0A916LAC0_MYCTX|nr:Uncharacterised protein [Mycobacterium tuberculosis]
MCTSVSSTRASGTEGCSPANDANSVRSFIRLSAVASSWAGRVRGAAPRSRSASITAAV